MVVRAVRIALLAVALLAVPCAPPALAARAHKPKPHCAVPRGWHVVARTAQAVVIWYFTKPDGPTTWQYCARQASSGRFHPFVETSPLTDFCPMENGPGGGSLGSISSISPLLLAGNFLAYGAECYGRGYGQGVAVQVAIRDVTTGRDAFGTVTGSPTAAGISPVLSPSGTAAWIVGAWSYNTPGPGGTWNYDVQALSMSTGRTSALDSDSVHQAQERPATTDPFAGLQLYSCVAGCAPNTTVVAWTHSGEQRYAQVG